MGSRDYRHRETKKTKKSGKKAISENLLPPSPVTVEVIKKGKKVVPGEEEEEE